METSGSLWFYSKDEASIFDADIHNTDDYKFFKYKNKLLGNTEADNPNGIFKNATIAVLLKYLSNFWRLLNIPLINCKVELKSKRAKYCVLSATRVDNVKNTDSHNITFIIKDKKLHVPVVTLSARDNQKLSKLLSKAFERSVYGN